MLNTLEIDGVKALISYDPDIEMFRGEFLGLNGGADFYAKDVFTLKKEAHISLKVFKEACIEDGVEPFKKFSGKFMARLPAKMHTEASHAAAAQGLSLNTFVQRAVEHELAYG